MKKLTLSLIITLLIVLPPALYAQTLGGRGFNKGGSGKSGFRGIVGKSKNSGFRGGFSNGFVTSNPLGTRSRSKNGMGFARPNFNKRGVRSSFSNRPNSAFFNNTASIKRTRPSINNSISNRRRPSIRLPKGLVVKSVKSEPKGLGTNLSAGANNFRSNSLRSRIKAKEGGNIASRENIISSIRGIRTDRFTKSGNKLSFRSKESNSNGLNNNLISNNRDVGKSRLQRAPTSIKGIQPKKGIGLTQSNLSTNHSGKEGVMHSVDDGVLHFTNRVNSHPREERAINVVDNNNKSARISRRLSLNRRVSNSSSLTNSVTKTSRNHLSLSEKRNTNFINSGNGFVVRNNNHHHHHASNNNDFVFSFNFFFGSPFFFPQPVFFPAFFNPFVFNPFIPPPLFPTTTFIAFPVFSPVIFQPIIASPVFIPFPFTTVFFVDAFAVNDFIIN